MLPPSPSHKPPRPRRSFHSPPSPLPIPFPSPFSPSSLSIMTDLPPHPPLPLFPSLLPPVSLVTPARALSGRRSSPSATLRASLSRPSSSPVPPIPHCPRLTDPTLLHIPSSRLHLLDRLDALRLSTVPDPNDPTLFLSQHPIRLAVLLRPPILRSFLLPPPPLHPSLALLPSSSPSPSLPHPLSRHGRLLRVGFPPRARR